MPTEDLRRQDDQERGYVKAMLESIQKGQQAIREDMEQDRREHRETHKDLYGKIGSTNLKIAFGTGLVVAGWEAVKHAFGGGK